MTAAPQIDVRDLKSVRRAADHLRRLGGGRAQREDEVLLGEDLLLPDTADQAMQAGRRRRGILALNRSPLARKIITFNLIGLAILLTGMLYFAPSRDSLAFQRAAGLVSEATLVANVVEARLPAGVPVNLTTGDGADPVAALSNLDLLRGVEVYLFDATGQLLASREGAAGSAVSGLSYESRSTWFLDVLNGAWDGIAGLFSRDTPAMGIAARGAMAADLAKLALDSGPQLRAANRADGDAAFLTAVPVSHNGTVIGAIALSSAPGEIDMLVRAEREQMLKMFGVGIIVSIALSLLLASTIANPIADLATAAELGRDRNARKMSPERIRIPDLSHRPDEIGRLSAAMRGMVTALYERIESNEQFAADVAHEIKNPLASLRSAVGTMRIAKRDDQREKLLDIIEHDVVRLDRLVTDISTASRLDADLVKEEEETFDLLKMLGNLSKYHATEASAKGIDFIADLPSQPILVQGLEGRLAQVFVNLVTNAISFCETGDAIRIWARKRGNRVLVVVEDTGPGIPEDALAKVFQRFYSERPAEHFGNNSGLGLAISKQIVEAHGGVIWAENIRPTEADTASEPLGARFVVGLPV